MFLFVIINHHPIEIVCSKYAELTKVIKQHLKPIKITH